MTKIQSRRGSAAEWTTANPILAAGEAGSELPIAPATQVKVKIGDGVTAWNHLPYFGESAAVAKSFAFTATTPGLTTGLFTGITVPAGAVLDYGPGLSVGFDSDFDGVAPAIAVAGSKAESVLRDYSIVIGQAYADGDNDLAGFTKGTDRAVTGGGHYLTRFVRETPLWIALINWNNDSNPGSTTGAGTLFVAYFVPTPA